MRLWEALKALEDGNAIRAKDWQPTSFIVMFEGVAVGNHGEVWHADIEYLLDVKEWEVILEGIEEIKEVTPEESFVESLILQPKGQGQIITIPADFDLVKVAEFLNLRLKKQEESIQMFSFADVLIGLKEGKAFRRLSWDDPEDRIFMKENGKLYSDKMFNIEEYEANDWVLVK